MRADRSLKVLHVVPSFYPAIRHGGPVQSLYDLCNALAADGVAVRVLTTDTAGPGERLDIARTPVQAPSGYPIYYCRKLAFASTAPSMLGRLPALIGWADLVHLTGVYNFPTLPTLTLARIGRKALVWSPRGALQRWEGSTRPVAKGLWEGVCRALLPGAAAIHYTSDAEQDRSGGRVAARTFVVPNGVSVPPASPSRRRAGPTKVLYLGRLDPIKGLENLLDAWAPLTVESHDAWRLTIAGAGEARYGAALEARIRTLGLTDTVSMVGEVAGSAKEALLNDSDLLVLPSHRESFGMVIAEALAHGVPVLAGRGTPWSDVERKGCGLWIDNDPASLAAALRRMRDLPLREMGQRGREWMCRDFTWEKRARQMRSMYQELLEAAR